MRLSGRKDADRRVWVGHPAAHERADMRCAGPSPGGRSVRSGPGNADGRIADSLAPYAAAEGVAVPGDAQAFLANPMLAAVAGAARAPNWFGRPHVLRSPVFTQTETCDLLSPVNGDRSQSAHRSRSDMPASFAIRSSSDGQTYRNGVLAGPKGRHDPGRRAVRHGTDNGLVTLGGRARCRSPGPGCAAPTGRARLPSRIRVSKQ